MKDPQNSPLTIIAAALLTTLALLLTPRTARADGPIYVDRDAPGPTHNGESWPTAYVTLQGALDVASAGDEIWVAAGVYTPTNVANEDATFYLESGVAIYGGFAGGEISRDQRDWEAHVTVLSGDIDGNDTTDRPQRHLGNVGELVKAVLERPPRLQAKTNTIRHFSLLQRAYLPTSCELAPQGCLLGGKVTHSTNRVLL